MTRARGESDGTDIGTLFTCTYRDNTL